ncbi:response regulator [Roseomonas sp. WA12]
MLHAPTAFVLSFALAATCGVILLFLWFQDRRHIATASWGAAHSLGAVALPLLALRGLIPDAVSIQFANVLMAATYGLIWAGARQFAAGPDSPRVTATPILAGAAAWLAACQIPAFLQSLDARVLAMGLIAAAYYLAAVWEFRRSEPVRTLRSRPLIIGILIANAAAYLLRIPCLLIHPLDTSAEGLPATLWYDLLVILGTALAGSTALALVALMREKEEQEASAALRSARDAADRASAGKSRFLAHMSHELRTPLNGVLGLAQLLRDDDALSETQRDRAAMLERAGRHLNALLNDVLDLSSIEAGRLELVAIPTRLHPLLEDIAGLSRAAAGCKGVHLRLDTAPDLPEAVLCDPLRLRQILHNLLGNAVKFTPPGGAVTLAAYRGEAGGLLLAVTDDGPGVPADVRDRLFQDYARATREAAKGDGTGLGLAISAGLARAMKGSIRFGTPPNGKGSVFEAWLPLPDTVPPALPAAPEPAPRACQPAACLHVLVVDDVAVNRLVLRAMLEMAGHAVTEASDGQSALDTIAATRPDIILMDVLMPGMDGLEATRRIRALPGPVARTRILAVTAGAMPDQIAACLDAGMDGSVTKPVDRRALLATLEAREPVAA